MKLIHKIVCLFAIILIPIKSFSQDVEWKANWIMHPTVQPKSHAVILFRKSFDLDVKPEKFVIHVSADNHYRLFVNGAYITRGPARGDISHWFYETLDIAAYLQSGKNTIAAEVINWGPRRSFTFFSQMSSFIMQGNSEAEKIVNTEGGNWKCSQNLAFSPKMVEWMTDRTTIDFGLYLGNPTDSIRADRYPWGWEKTNFDDSAWLPALWCDLAGGRNTQDTGGILYGGGKLLIPRRTGLLKETKVPFAGIRRANGMVISDHFLKGTGRLTIPAYKKVSILIDQAEETMGYPEMLVSGGKNACIQVMYAENLIVNNKSPKGDRNNIEGKRMVGLKDVFIPDGGKNRLFKPTYLRAFRFIQLDIETRDEPLIIENYSHVACMAPIELKAKFETDNPLTDWIMDAGWRTVSICAQDMLLSDAAYEQLQYTGDSRVHNLTLLTLSGDDRLTRNALIQFDQSRIPEGLTYACYPNPFHLIIPSYSLIWIDQVHDYMMWNDDKAFISGFELGIYSVLDWFEKRMQPNGLLGKIDWWGALAWPRHYKNGEPPTVYTGNNTLYSLHYAYTLRHAADIFDYLGKSRQASEYRSRAGQICLAVNSLCKNEVGFYTESPDNKKVSQITNLLAILAEATSGDAAKQLMKQLLEPKDWFGQVDLFLHSYLFEAMNKTGLQDHFLPEISEWQLMMDRNLTTFVEVPLEWGEENQRSECHPWSSVPNYFFFRTVCGIKPLSAGHKTVEIAPAFVALTQIKATYPHHLGNIELDLKRTGNTVEGSVIIPAGIQASFVWGDQRIDLREGKQTVRLGGNRLPPAIKRFFAENSFWNQPLGDQVEIDPKSNYFISLLKKDHSHQNFGINLNNYTIPVYEVEGTVPLIKVGNHPGFNFRHHPDFDKMGVPIPPGFKPSPGSDQHATIIDWKRKLAWDMFLVEKDSAGHWVSCTGVLVPLDGPGVFKKADFAVRDDESIHQYGPSRAAGVPSFAGTIMYDEVLAGEINHKLSCAVRFVALKEYVYPAIWTDGNFKGGVPEGSIIQLDPLLDLSEFDLLPGELAVAKALQKYGMVVVDFAAGNVLYGEGLWIYPDKSWKGLLRDWDGGVCGIPLDHFRVLKNHNVQKGGDRIKDFFQESLKGWEKNQP